MSLQRAPSQGCPPGLALSAQRYAKAAGIFTAGALEVRELLYINTRVFHFSRQASPARRSSRTHTRTPERRPSLRGAALWAGDVRGGRRKNRTLEMDPGHRGPAKFLGHTRTRSVSVLRD